MIFSSLPKLALFKAKKNYNWSEIEKRDFQNFYPFSRPKRVYHGEDISFDKKMEFSSFFKILGHFKISANLGNFSKFFGYIFLYDKNGHTYQFIWKKLQNWVFYWIKSTGA